MWVDRAIRTPRAVTRRSSARARRLVHARLRLNMVGATDDVSPDVTSSVGWPAQLSDAASALVESSSKAIRYISSVKGTPQTLRDTA